MSFAGIYTGTVHEYCAEFNYTDSIEIEVDPDNKVSALSNQLGFMQGGVIDSSGHISGLLAPIDSLSLGNITLSYSGDDNGTSISLSGTAANGTIGSIQANLTQTYAYVTTTDHGDGTHSITGSGDDLTLHSIGNDVMTGGGVRDTFVFTPGFGQDEITDFVASGSQHDTIDLSNTHYASFAQVLRHTSMSDGSATIHLNPQDSITLDGVTKAQLRTHPNDFALA